MPSQRQSPSGPIDGFTVPAGTSVGQVPTWNGTDYVPQTPTPTVNLGGYYRATNDANTFPTTGTNNWVAGNSAAYQEVLAGTELTFTAASCVVTYTGSVARRYLVTVMISYGDPGGDRFLYISHNGDLIGVSALAGPFDSMADFGGSRLLVAQRMVTLTTGQTVQPIVAVDTIGSDLGIERLSMSIEQVNG